MLTKTIIVITLLLILVTLGSSLVYLVRDDGKSKRTLKALSWRIGLSIGLFLFLFLAFSLNWIRPHALLP